MNKQDVWERKGIKIKCLQYLIDNNEKIRVIEKLFSV
ncbi:Uncharacterised protein [Salmonella enterica subsp. enterica]|uniref:Uncharacterized protein n=1 Tax=Salmonella enterica I TaxID=59201 RepID=A0A447N1Q0_SALET|nr:Uncharacterised protein [Salmonella enterica subsp. enterica]